MLTDIQLKEIEKIRQTLHKYPELSGAESETALFIKGTWSGLMQMRSYRGIGGAGCWAYIMVEDPERENINDSGRT